MAYNKKGERRNTGRTHFKSGQTPWNKGKNNWEGKEHPKGMKGKQHSKETKLKIGAKSKGRISGMKGKIPWNFGKNMSEESKKKMRISAFNHAKIMSDAICPRLGLHEKQILDKLEISLNHKIIRQYPIEGYFLDGYIPELNLAIEIDERPKNQDKDIERQKIIEVKLNCKFLRIKDFD